MQPTRPTPSPQADTAGRAVPPSPLLRLHQAQVSLPGRLLGPFSVAVAAGQRIAIVGPSGAGKSSLLRLMAGELPAHGGQAWLDGRALSAWPLPALARRRAVLPQQHGVAFGLPVALVVSLGRLAHEPDPARDHIVTQALRAARAEHLLHRRFDTLSGGEQARVQLARVLAQLWDARGGMLLVDEPLAALDPGLQLAVLDTLHQLARDRGHALVAVLHDLNQALSGFDRLWLVQQGQLVADLPADRHAVPALAALFGLRLQCVDVDDGRIGVLVRGAAASPVCA